MQSITLAVLACLISVVTAGTQSYRVKGKLICDEKPLAGTCVKLWNKNVGLDSVMGKGTTDSQGFFDIKGYANEAAGNIKPKLKIYHTCGGKLIGKHKLKFELPANKITKDSQIPTALHDMGSLNMNTKYPGQETELQFSC